ncbi:MAG: hypothetical protein KAT06_06275 [Gammaproteobacteria bacterium]|nr:hypothetical protein [Gammaproteobacteria bacterium]
MSYDANNVYLSLVRNDVNFSTTGVTPNQTAVFNALDTLVTTNPLAVTDLMNNLIELNDSDVHDALDSLSGVTHSAMPGLSNLLMRRFFQSIHFYRGNQDLSSSFGAFSNEGSSRSLLGLNSGDAFGKDNLGAS